MTADHVAIGCFQGEAPPSDSLGEALAEAVGQLGHRPGWKGQWTQRVETHLAAASNRGRPTVLTLWGLGPRERFDAGRTNGWLHSLTGHARINGGTRLGIVFPKHAETIGANAAERIARHLLLSDYRYDRFRKLQELEDRQLAKIQLSPPSGELATYQRALVRARILAEAVALARGLANCPASEATPRWFAEQARETLTPLGFDVLELGPEELAARGMGGILGVGRGSANPPRLLRLEWGQTGPLIALVGKGVTFDSGGLSLKSNSSMVDMKYDKSGACSMLAVAQAVARLDLPVRLRVYLPMAENMPGGDAYRPGDILRCYNGKTVEILNTDAEGRLVLADALAWAVEEQPDALLEYSTLTGGAVVALGRFGAALFTPDDDLARELEDAARASGEQLWRLPLWNEYSEEMKGNHADLRNSAGRFGAAGLAAGFLSEFVGNFKKWAHLDIAGTAHTPSDRGRGGATGYGVALAVEWIHQRSS